MSQVILEDYDRALEAALVAHGEVEMDTPEDRELHARAMAAFRDLQKLLRARAGLLPGGQQ
jgi:hypothetical protein